MIKFYELVHKSSELRVTIASSEPINKKIGSEIIKAVQNTKFSHVLIIVNDLVFQASHGRVNVFHITEFLVENNIIDSIVIDHSECDFEYIFKSLGRKYGFGQLYKYALKYILLTKLKIIKKFKYKDNGEKYVICSEHVGRFLKLPWVNDLTSPEEIISYLYTIKK